MLTSTWPRGRRPHRPARPRTAAAAASAAALLAVTAVMVPAPASAAGETLTVALSQQTGTTPFDADDAAGHDSSPSNDVIRTNDVVTYTVGLNTAGGGDQMSPTITLALPQGEELVSLPPFCLAGSSVVPPALPSPALPITPTSYQSLPAQTVTCVIATQAVNTSLDYQFLSRVRPEVPNGAQLGPIAATAASQQVTQPVSSNTVSHSVSAAPRFDISKRLDSDSDANGPFYTYYGACSFDPARACRLAEYPLTLSAPAGGKGISPLASPITLVDDLSPDVFYGPGTTTSPAWIAAGAGAADKYGARLTVCNSGVLNLHGFLPGPSGGNGTTIPNAVRDSGTIACSQPGGPGTPVQITITGADTSAFTTPTQNNDGGALPANEGLVISTALRVEIPVDAVTDLGQSAGGTYALSTHNEFTDIVAADITGAPNVDDPANNVRDAVQRLEIGDGIVQKAFVGITGQPGNEPPPAFGGVWEGLPGSSYYRDGNTVVVPGQTVISAITSTRHSLPPLSGTQYSNSTVACDTWDDTKLALPQTFDYAGAGYTYLGAPSNGSPAWMASWTDGSTTGIDPSAVANLRFQYGYTATPGPGADSSCETGTWADTPAAVPGATLVDGAWQGVNRVRVSFTDKAGPVSDFFILNVAIAMTVVSDDPIGTVLPNWVAQVTTTGVQGLDAILADPARRPTLSTYQPDSALGTLGDRLILGNASVRVAKDVRNPTSGQFTDSAIPQYSAGSTIDYRLRPSLTASVTTGLSADVVLEDCLPRYQTLVSSVRESGAAITPFIASSAPAGAGIACAEGETYVRWELGPNVIGQVIDPVIYTVEVLATARNGNYTNTVVVSSPADGSPAAARTDTAQIQLVVPTGIKIAKSVDKPVIEVNPDGVAVPRTLTWTVDFANVDSPINVSDADVIDVLPTDAVNGSAFAGDLIFDAAAPAAGTSGVTILYSRTASAALSTDPGDPSNSAGGSTVWCSAVAGGTVVLGSGSAADCPASAADVTGLRFQRPGAFESDDQFTMTITMTPTGNAAGDVYENRAGGRVTGVTLQVGPAVRQSRVVASSIGDYVWDDVNGNGVQDEGEPGIAGFPVMLIGTDVDGNAVSRGAVTDADGKYLFDGLASGTYTVTFDPAGLPDSYHAFTQQNAGEDDAADSDGDPSTGVTATIELPIDTSDMTIDQGIVDTTPPVGSISLAKVIVDPNPDDTLGDAASFPVSITCAGPQDLPEVVHDLELPRDGTAVVIDGLIQGAVCSIEETDADGGDASYSATEVTVGAQTVQVTITNTFPAKAIEPTPPTPTAPVAVPAAPTPSSPLALTGASVLAMSISAVAVIGLGAILLIAGRHRRRSERS